MIYVKPYQAENNVLCLRTGEVNWQTASPGPVLSRLVPMWNISKHICIYNRYFLYVNRSKRLS